MRWNRRRSGLYGTPSPLTPDLRALRSALQELLADGSPLDPFAPARCPTRTTLTSTEPYAIDLSPTPR